MLPALPYASWISGPLGVAAALVVTALLLARFEPRRRRALRRAALLFLIYTALLGVALLSTWGGSTIWASRLTFFAKLLELLIVVHLAAAVVFDFVVPLTRIRPASIVSDLAVGVAYLVVLAVGLRRLGVEPSSIVATSAVATAVIGLSL